MQEPIEKTLEAVLTELDESAKSTTLSRRIIAATGLESVPLCLRTLQNARKILVAGNGGSAADAEHFAAELTGRYRRDRRGQRGGGMHRMADIEVNVPSTDPSRVQAVHTLFFHLLAEPIEAASATRE